MQVINFLHQLFSKMISSLLPVTIGNCAKQAGAAYPADWKMDESRKIPWFLRENA